VSLIRRPRVVLFIGFAFTVAAIVAGVALAGASDQQSQIVSADDALSVIEGMGHHVPTQSCLAQPRRRGCPKVSRVVIQVGVPGTAQTDYGPPATSPPPTLTQGAAPVAPSAASNANVCAVTASTPHVYSTASTTAQNVCQPGYPVTDMELWGNIMRWSSSDGRWYTLNDCYTQRHSDGWQSCTASFDCYHPNTELEYRGEGDGYVVIGGTGYFGTHDSASEWAYCY
jgi:hypothetical protein